MKIFSVLNNPIVKKKVILSALLSFFLLVIGYFLNNLPLFNGENLLQLRIANECCNLLGINKGVEYGDNVYFNIGYDKTLVPIVEANDTVGTFPYIDRDKVYTFLKWLHKSDKYKFVILDFAFDKSYRSTIDDSLFNLVSKMRDVVFVSDAKNSPLIRADLASKTAMASYYITDVSTNFTRFEFTRNDSISMPLYIYERLNSEGKIKRYGLGRFSIYFSGGKLCQNSVFLTLDKFNLCAHLETINGNQVYSPSYKNLGVYLKEIESYKNDSISDNEILEKVINTDIANKNVVVGNFILDVHDTYKGPKAGSLIVMRALQSLNEKRHIVSIPSTILWFIVFFITIYFFVLNPKSIKLNNKHPKYSYIIKFLNFCLEIVSYTIVFQICSIFEYIAFDRVYGIMIPVMLLSLLKIYVQFKTFYNYENK